MEHEYYNFNDLQILPSFSLGSFKPKLYKDGKMPLFYFYNVAKDNGEQFIKSFKEVDVCLPNGITPIVVFENQDKALDFLDFGIYTCLSLEFICKKFLSKTIDAKAAKAKSWCITVSTAMQYGQTIECIEALKVKAKSLAKECHIMLRNVNTPEQFKDICLQNSKYYGNDRGKLIDGQLIDFVILENIPIRSAARYPMPMLIKECYEATTKSFASQYCPTIICDEGFSNNVQLVISLGLGADYAILPFKPDEASIKSIRSQLEATLAECNFDNLTDFIGNAKIIRK